MTQEQFDNTWWAIVDDIGPIVYSQVFISRLSDEMIDRIVNTCGVGCQ